MQILITVPLEANEAPAASAAPHSACPAIPAKTRSVRGWPSGVAMDALRSELPEPAAPFPQITGDSEVNNGVEVRAAGVPTGSSIRSIKAPPAVAAPAMAKVVAEKLQLIVAVAAMAV